MHDGALRLVEAQPPQNRIESLEPPALAVRKAASKVVREKPDEMDQGSVARRREAHDVDAAGDIRSPFTALTDVCAVCAPNLVAGEDERNQLAPAFHDPGGQSEG